jgi:hypothetical protein
MMMEETREGEPGREQGERGSDEEDLVSVYRAPDELLALSVRALLEAEGIRAEVRSAQMPWYDGIAKMMRPAWGDVVVLARDRDRSKRLVDEFLSGRGLLEERAVEE